MRMISKGMLVMLLFSGCASIHIVDPEWKPNPQPRAGFVYSWPKITVTQALGPGDVPVNFGRQLHLELTALCASNQNRAISDEADVISEIYTESISRGDNPREMRASVKELMYSNWGLYTFLPFTPLMNSQYSVVIKTSFIVTNGLADVVYCSSVYTAMEGLYSGWGWLRYGAREKLDEDIVAMAPRYVALSLQASWENSAGMEKYKKAKQLVSEARAELKLAEAGNAVAQYNMGLRYHHGIGVNVDYDKALQWFRKSAEQGKSYAQHVVSICLANGIGGNRNMPEAVRWCLKSAAQGYTPGQFTLGQYYLNGEGVVRDPRESYKWNLLASAWGGESLRSLLERVEGSLSSADANEAREWAKTWMPKRNASDTTPDAAENETLSSGTGFLISKDGYLATASHVVAGAKEILVRFDGEMIKAVVIASDSANDVAILKLENKKNREFPSLCLPIHPGAKLGERVFTIGFPLPTLQGNNPKLSKGDVCALSGMHDDPRHMQISIPIQSGNSGGVLANESGEVVGIIVSKLNALVVAGMTGELIQNVNYAVKGSYVRTLADSIREWIPSSGNTFSTSAPPDQVIDHVKSCSVLIKVKAENGI